MQRMRGDTKAHEINKMNEKSAIYLHPTNNAPTKKSPPRPSESAGSVDPTPLNEILQHDHEASDSAAMARISSEQPVG